MFYRLLSSTLITSATLSIDALRTVAATIIGTVHVMSGVGGHRDHRNARLKDCKQTARGSAC